MEFGVLGPLRVTEGRRDIALTSPTQRVILASLLARAGTVISADALIDAVWGDDPPATAVSSLRSHVSRLRRSVGERIAASADGYALHLREGDAIDADRFDAALRRLRADRSPTVVALVVDAMTAWRGRAYGELSDTPTVRVEARRLDVARLDAAELLAWADFDAGRFAAAAAAAEAVLADDDLREGAWEVSVRSLHRAGRSAEATRAAQRAAAALAEAGLVAGQPLRDAEAEALGAASLEPPARADAAVRPPEPLTETVGRESDRIMANVLLDEHRLVTLVGPGGVGKTRLAIDVARARADAHSRGVAFVELARVADASGVVSSIAGALDLRVLPGGEVAALDGLGGVDVLVVLDNCEHVIDAVVEAVPRLLASGHRMRILATSREALAIGGEHVMPVAPLAIDGATSPAVALFRQLANAVAPAAPLDEALIADVVARVDGLPLALEMAAARLRTMSLDELADSIGRDLDLLTTQRRDVEPRHRTVRDLMAWSEQLLDDELRQAMFDFSVFAGPVGAHDLAAAISTPHPAATAAALVDRSLIIAESSDTGFRFRALETVRGYGRQRLREAGLHAAARRRHAEWFRDVAQQIDAGMRTADEPAAIRRFVGTFDELRAAFRWALAEDLEMAAEIVCRLYVVSRALLRAEVVGWAADLCDRLPADHPARPAVRGALAGGLTTLGRLDDAVRIGEEVLAEEAPGAAVIFAVEGLADAATYAGRLDDAVRLAEMATRLGHEIGDPLYSDFGRIGASLAMAYRGSPDEALAMLESGPSCPAPSVQGWFEYVRGETILDRDPPAALDHLDRALDIAGATGSRYLTEIALLSASSLRARTGDVAEAAARFGDLLDHFGVGGDPTHLVTSLRNLVTLLVRIDQPRAAAALFGAVGEHPTSPSYGPEAERVAAAVAECRTLLGDAELERVVEVGRRRGLDAAADAARTTLRTHMQWSR